MQGEKSSRAPFDDRAALEELERLQRSIQEYRRRREAAEGAFEQFVGSFRKPGVTADEGMEPARTAQLPGFHTAVAASDGVPAVLPPPIVPPAAVVVPPVAPPPPSVSQPLAAAPEQVDPDRGPAPAVSLPDNFFSSATGRSLAYGDGSAGVPATRTAGTRDFPGWIFWAFLGTAAVLIAAVFLMRSGGAPAAPDEAPAPAAVETPAAAPPPAAAAPAPGPVTSPAPAPVTAPAPPAEIRTLRSVWVRVTVDGRREVERELEADAKIPLPAGRSFVIRAGDAGAVRFLLNGEDQGALGPDAQVVTRTFTAPAR